MKAWLTLQEIADLALPGLPTSKRGVSLLADREGWAASTRTRQRQGRGGGFEHHIDLLPAAARLAYVARFGQAETLEQAAVAVQSAPDVVALTSAAGGELDARLHIVGMFRAMRQRADLRHTTALALFVDLYNTRQAEAPDWVRAIIPSLAARTLARWLSALREGETGRLAVDRGAGRRGSSVLETGADGRVKAFALALVAQNPLYSARHIHEALTDRFRDLGIPSQRAVERALKAWRAEHRVELMALTNPDKFVSTTRVSGSYAHTVSRLNELWQIDASPADALCTDGRHSVYVCIDVFSRRMLVTVTRTARAEAVQLLVRAAILAWGVPERIKTDNGSDFVAKSTKRLFAALGLEVETSTAYSPWQKGVVERAIRTLQHDCMTTLPGFVGHSVADRKVIEARKRFAARLGQDDAAAFQVSLSAAELQADVSTWAEMVYAHRAHGGIGGLSPFEKAATFTGSLRRVDEGALGVLLMPAAGSDGIRTVGKTGVRIGGFHYLCPGLVVGDRVFVRLDPTDAGRIHLFSEDGVSFLGLGRCPELTGEDRAALVAEVAAAQKAAIAEGTAAIRREAKSIDARTVLDSRNRLALEKAGKLVAMPRARVEHVTPQLTAAAEAAGRSADAPARPQRPAPRPVDAKLQAAIEADLAGSAPVPPAAAPAANITRLRTVETPAQRFRRALELEARLAAGGALATDEALWLGGYQASAECRAQRTIFEDFGEQGLG
jgi:putative transposase